MACDVKEHEETGQMEVVLCLLGFYGLKWTCVMCLKLYFLPQWIIDASLESEARGYSGSWNNRLCGISDSNGRLNWLALCLNGRLCLIMKSVLKRSLAAGPWDRLPLCVCVFLPFLLRRGLTVTVLLLFLCVCFMSAWEGAGISPLIVE